MIDPRRHAARVLAALAAAALLVSCGGSDDDPPPQPAFGQVTYVFGSSISDTGNTCNLIPANCKPTPPYATGRFSDGQVFAEIIAARYGAAVTPSRTGGNNFAYGGARTGAIAGTIQGVPNMVTQLDQYFARVNFVSSANALFIVEARRSATTSSMP